MITKQMAVDAPHSEIFHHVSLKNADGSPLRVRKTGMCKVWVTRPDEFRMPFKHGLYDHGYITHENCHEWVTSDE